MMNNFNQVSKYKLWNNFHQLIENELNAEKNQIEKQALFEFLDERMKQMGIFSKTLEDFSRNYDENLLASEVKHLKELIIKLQNLRDSMNHPFVLYVMGMGKVGKSSLLNLLVGSKVADVDVLPKTWKTDFFYAAEEDNAVTVKYRSGSEKKVSAEIAKQLVLEEEEKREDSEDEIEKKFRELSKKLSSVEDKVALKEELIEKFLYRSDIKEIQWGLNHLPTHSILHQFSLVDTPGLWQSHHGTHGEHVGDFYHQADGILWLLDSTTLSANKPKQVLDQLSNTLQYVGQKSQNMLAVLSQIDKVRQVGGDIQVNQVIQSAKQIFDGYFLDVLPCSAKEAKLAQHNQDDALLQQSGYPDLLNKIQKFFYDNAFSLRIEGKANNFIGMIETHLQNSQLFLQRFDKDLIKYDLYQTQITDDLKRMHNQCENNWTLIFESYNQKVKYNISNKVDAYLALNTEQEKSDFVQREIFNILELERILNKFKKDKSLILQKYSKQIQQQVSKSFERYSFINEFNTRQLSNLDNTLSIYKNTEIDFSGTEVEGVLVGGAAAGVAMLLLGPVGLIAGAIGFFWSQSRKVDKAKESFEKQLSVIQEDCEKNVDKFLEHLFEVQKKQLIEYLDQHFKALYLPRENAEQVLSVYKDLEQMKSDKFNRVTFQNFILGAK